MNELSTNERLRLLLGAPQKQAKANCRLIEQKELSGLEREQLQREIQRSGK